VAGLAQLDPRSLGEAVEGRAEQQDPHRHTVSDRRSDGT
jgi:hypothetical protein